MQGGIPRRPVQMMQTPSTKKSRWYADPFFSLKSLDCAMMELTLWSKMKRTRMMAA